MNLIIDEGNTRIKLAVFEDVQLVELIITNIEDCKTTIDNIIDKYDDFVAGNVQINLAVEKTFFE